MKIKFLPLYLFIACASLFLTSCSDDDDAVVDITVTPPSSYKFERNGKSTVSFSGQSSRLKMAGELYSGMKSSSSTKAGLNNMFNNGTGFSDTKLDASGKKVGNKTFASSVASATVKPMFDSMITDFADNVIPNWSTTAADGTAGKMTDSKRTVYINAKGHELTQLFTKGLIGGMTMDQIVNGYLSAAKLDTGTNRADNDAGTLVSGEDYTQMEHYWDEGFGYLYGEEADVENPTLGNGVLLSKYAGKVDGSNSPGIGKIIYDAFKMGRAAIVAKNYAVRDAQAKIIQMHISKIIGYKAHDYLNDYVTKAAAGTPADAIHALSEGYGFIMSLQVTNDGTGKPYFTNAEVNTMLAKIENFWTVSSADCTAMANDIKAKMNL
tara:strand:- start:1206 stop:2345 length:1140 start_codon:yes stop_codon:yes gene_type:complete